MYDVSNTKAGIVAILGYDIIILTVTGTISFLSSLTIIYIIARSKNGIKTTYHRIILGLSIADCLASLATLLTTIPMPKDVIYPFATPSYGSVATCEAQGIIFIIGNVNCLYMNGILNVYYLCTLRFKIQDDRSRYYLEIPFSFLALALNIGILCRALLNKQMMNPNPIQLLCSPSSYPFDCTKVENPDCRGEGGPDVFYNWLLTLISIAAFMLFVTMALTIHSFNRNERKLRKALKDNKQIQEDDQELQDLLYAQKASGIITFQALLYIAAFVLTWIFCFVQALWLTDKIELSDQSARTISILRIIFKPLQGLFNLIIFVYHKVHTLRHADEGLTVSEAIAKIFLFPGEMEDQAVIANLNMVVDNYVEKLQKTKNRKLEMVSDMERCAVVGDISVISSNVKGFGFDSVGIRSQREPSDDNDMLFLESQTVKSRLSGFSLVSDFSFGSATVKV